MSDEIKNQLIEELVKDFKANEGKNAGYGEVLLLRGRLANFTVDELRLLLPLDEQTLAAVREEIAACYEPEEMAQLATFEDFFASEDVRNAYEEEWDAEKYRPYYQRIWNEIKGEN